MQKFGRKPCDLSPGIAARSPIRVSQTTKDILDTIHCALAELYLSSADHDLKVVGLHMTSDQALRIALTTFARDYRIAHDHSPKEK